MVCVHVVDHCVHVLVVPSSGFVLEVTSEEAEDIVGQVVINSAIEVAEELLGSGLSVEVFRLLVCFE